MQHGTARLRFDYSRVYWNSRLHSEHARMAAEFGRGELVWDLFAGVGPFAVLAAQRGVQVLANDLNPASAEALVVNARRNGVSKLVGVYNLDAAEFVERALRSAAGGTDAESLAGSRLPCALADGEGGALDDASAGMEGRMPSHVLMNLPADSLRFLEPLRLLKAAAEGVAERPCVHCYCFSRCASAAEQREEAEARLEEALGWVPEVSVRTVRTVAPRKEMLCYSFEL